MMKRLLYNFAKHFLLILFCASTLVPLFFVIITALGSRKDTVSRKVFPQSISLDSFISVISKYNILKYLVNSSKLVVLAIIITVLFSYIICYNLYYISKFRNIIMNSVILIRFFPTFLFIVPFYIYITKIGLSKTILGLLIPYIVLAMPPAIWILMNSIIRIPISIVEAAILDGSSKWIILFKIFFPLSFNSICTVVFYSGFNLWSEYMFAQIFASSDSNKTLMVVISEMYNSAQYGLNEIMATLIISLIPQILLFVLFQKYFFESISSLSTYSS